jgi:hypothetical protein
MLALLGLMTGLDLELMQRVYFCLLLLVLLAGLAAWLSLANFLKKIGYGGPWKIVRHGFANYRQGIMSPSTLPIPSVPVTGASTITLDPTKTAKTPKASVIIVMVLTGSLGWMVRDAQLHVPPRQYRDILVTARHSATQYELAFPGAGKFNITTCHPVDWQENEKMRTLAYMQRVGCKDVTIDGWYQFFTAPDGTRMKFERNKEELYAHK